MRCRCKLSIRGMSANMMLFLCSDEARYVTGETFSVDAGYGVS